MLLNLVFAAKVVTPATETLSKFVCPSTSNSPFKSIPVATIDAVFTVPEKVVTPATLRLSKLVCPSTSKSPFKSIPVAVTLVAVKIPIL